MTTKKVDASEEDWLATIYELKRLGYEEKICTAATQAVTTKFELLKKIEKMIKESVVEPVQDAELKK